MTEVRTPEFELLRPDLWAGKNYIGSWTATATTLDATDKATGEIIGTLANANVEDVAKATLQARTIAPAWAAVPPAERARIVRLAGDLLIKYKEEAVYWLIRETGSTRYKAEFEIAVTKDYFDHAADLLDAPWRTVLKDDADTLSYYERLPLGVVAVIGPFNWPLVLALRAVAPALAAGNSVVLRPSSNTAVAGGLLLARLFEEAGLPAGVLSVLTGSREAGEALVRDPNVAMIAFTGSTGVGRDIGGAAGAQLKRFSLELGGKNPFVVLEDADIELAARAGAFATFLHQGQICIAVGLHIVHESVADAYGARLAELAREMKVGDPWREQVALGPIISERQRDKIHEMVEDAQSQGARILQGGVYNGPFYYPTVVTNLSSSARLVKEEVFGPIAPIVTFKDEEEALRLANGSGYGLAASVFGELEHARTFAKRVESGMVHVNDQPVKVDTKAPFGGVKASGNGTRIGTERDLDEYTTFRWVTEMKTIPSYTLTNG
jgi:benzaldehyde dehydrogenase (NAD)